MIFERTGNKLKLFPSLPVRSLDLLPVHSPDLLPGTCRPYGAPVGAFQELWLSRIKLLLLCAHWRCNWRCVGVIPPLAHSRSVPGDVLSRAPVPIRADLFTAVLLLLGSACHRGCLRQSKTSSCYHKHAGIPDQEAPTEDPGQFASELRTALSRPHFSKKNRMHIAMMLKGTVFDW